MLREKALLCSGLDMWHTVEVARLGVPSMMMTDSPHGLRKEKGGGGQTIMKDSYPSTCFPTASALASTLNRELIGMRNVQIIEILPDPIEQYQDEQGNQIILWNRNGPKEYSIKFEVE